MSKIKVGSDFSGVGAFDQALKRLALDYTTVFACDMDKYARQTFEHNYGKPVYYPENVYNREIPIESLDIYMTSPPCQAFSLAGKRGGESDKRGILFYNSHEFIMQNKPRFFIFENVKGLLSDDQGRTFNKWIEALGGKSVNGTQTMFVNENAAPYHIYYQVLNAKNYGIPQNRERVFIIGIRDDKDNNFDFPKKERLTKRLKDVLENEVDQKYFLSDEDGVYNISRLNKTLKKNKLPLNEPVIIDSYNQTIHKESICISTRVNASSCTHVWDTKELRRLTPRECFRLMDFPDTFTWNVSDSQAYKQAGNSICVGVLAKIIKKIQL